MQRLGCVTSVWLIFSGVLKLIYVVLIFCSPRLMANLAALHVTFGDPAIYAVYLFVTAVFCFLILGGHEWALHLWLAISVIAALWDYLFRPHIAPWTPLAHLLGPVIVYILFSFGGASRGTR